MMEQDLLKTKDPRWNQQLEFVLEIDKLKHVIGHTLLPAGRRENAAEHSWHLAMLALTLAEYANETVDIHRVVLLMLVHSLVKIDTGDMFVYDEEALGQQATSQQQAAERIFGLLPTDQTGWVCQAWAEFQQQATPEARFANALHRFQSILLSYAGGGEMWRQYGLTASRVLAGSRSMETGSTRLWQYTQALLHEAVQQGYLRP